MSSITKSKSKSQRNRIFKRKIEQLDKLAFAESAINTKLQINRLSIPINKSLLPSTSNKAHVNDTLMNIDNSTDINVSLLAPNLNFNKDIDKVTDINIAIPVNEVNMENDDDNTNIIHANLNVISPDSNISCKSTSDFLVKWSIDNKISHIALSQLLSFLSSCPNLNDLPKDARTLLQTPRKALVENMGSGKFIYIGFRDNFQNCFKVHNTDHMALSFNIDGLPIQRSTKNSFWPILCRIVNCSYYPVFPVAVYCGKGKPPLEDFLTKFIKDLQEYLMNGFKVHKTIIKFSIHSFICDTPAKSYIKRIKGHNGYSGCDKCMCKGMRYNKRMIFLSNNSALRTDANFREKVDILHNSLLNSPLINLDIDMISTFPNDYMHSVCLGVVRKLLFAWRDGGREYNIKRNLNQIDERINSVKTYWPTEFNRKPRSLSELEHWKATEFRSFLIYYGPFLCRDILPEKYYKHLLLLQLGITILLNNYLNCKYNKYASDILKTFVTNTKKLYGKEFIIYNVHSLIHLADDAKQFKSLNNINAFPFENYLQTLKSKLRKSNMPLEQIYQRLNEELNANIVKYKNNTLESPVCLKKCESLENDLGLTGVTFYKQIKFSEFTISILKKADSYVILNNKIDTIEIKYICQNETTNEIVLYGYKFNSKFNFDNYPTKENVLTTFFIEKDENAILQKVNLSDLWCKAVVMVIDNLYVSKPLYHYV